MPETIDMGTQPSTRVIDHPASIQRYLYELWEQQQPLLLSFDSDPREKIHEARIQKLDMKADRIILGMLLPVHAGDSIELSRGISVSTSSEQGKLFFSSSLDMSEESDLPGQCVIYYPKQLLKEQHRNAYRVSLLQHANRVVISDSQEREFSGTCLDLSVSGLLFQFNRNIDIPCAIGQEFDYCHVDIAGMIDFTCRAAVRRCEQTGKSGLLLGLSFDGLTEQHARELSRALARLERNSLRHKSPPANARPLLL